MDSKSTLKSSMLSSSSATTDFIVVGGGIIGVSCAYHLLKAGHSVRLIERGEIGMGCSYGNAGWLTPCFALPLSMPGLLFKSLKWMMDPEGPLYIKPSLNPDFLLWLMRFMKAMNWQQAHKSIEALVELSQKSLTLYTELADSSPKSFGFEKKGLLMVAQTDAGMKDITKELDLVSKYGVRGQTLSSTDLHNFEPSLQGVTKGGVFFPDEAHVEPLEVVKALMELSLVAGLELNEATEVQRFTLQQDRIVGVETNQGVFKADQVILATGSWSKALSQDLGVNFPVLGGKGYAVIVPPLKPMPRMPIMLLERKIAVTPRAQSLRIAGTLELVDQDFSITQRRVDAILRGARTFLPLPEQIQKLEVWRGLRPCTPDGVPVLGRSTRISNLIWAAGHQMLGLQSGMGTGLYISQLAAEKTPWLKTTVFEPGRFGL